VWSLNSKIKSKCAKPEFREQQEGTPKTTQEEAFQENILDNICHPLLAFFFPKRESEH
jgi:hypothetical protein